MKTFNLLLLAFISTHSFSQEKIFEEHFYQVHQDNKASHWNIVGNTYGTPTERRVPGNSFLWGYDYVLEHYVNLGKHSFI